MSSSNSIRHFGSFNLETGFESRDAVESAPVNEHPVKTVVQVRKSTPAERAAAKHLDRLRIKRAAKRARQGKSSSVVPPMPNWYRPSRKLKKSGNRGVAETLNEAWDHSTGHREEIESSTLCGCFYCMATYPPDLISRWEDGGETPVCPQCGTDSVIGAKSGFPIDDERFLLEMHDFWFGDTRGERVKSVWRAEMERGSQS